MPGERAEDEEVAVPETKGVPGTPLIFLPRNLDPLVRAEAADDEEEESDDNDGDEQEDPEICAHRRVIVMPIEESFASYSYFRFPLPLLFFFFKEDLQHNLRYVIFSFFLFLFL